MFKKIDKIYSDLLAQDIRAMDDTLKIMREAYKKLSHLRSRKCLLKQNFDSGLDSLERLVDKGV